MGDFREDPYTKTLSKKVDKDIRSKGMLIKKKVLKKLYFSSTKRRSSIMRLFRWLRWICSTRTSIQKYVIRRKLDYKNIYLSHWTSGSLSHYGVNLLGQVKNTTNDKVIYPRKNKDGYKELVHYKGQSISIHRFMAEVYLELPKVFRKKHNTSSNYEVNHIDFNRANNDIENLQWVTRGQNMAHMIGKRKQAVSAV